MIEPRAIASLLLATSLLAGCASANSDPPRRPRADPPAPPDRPRVAVSTEAVPMKPPEPPPAAQTAAAVPPLAAGPRKPSAAPPAPLLVTATTTPAAAETAAPAATSAPSPRLVLNFDNADIEVVIQAAAEIVGFNYVLGPGARGRKVTVQTVGKLSPDEVFDVLLTILDVNGLAAVRSGNLYRIIPREGAPQYPIRTIVGREASTGLPPDEVVSQIVPLQFVAAQEAMTLLRPFLPPQGAIAAHPETNLLMITDTVANIRRLLGILRLADVQVALDDLQIIALRHADAQELAQLLAQLFATGRFGTGATRPTPAPPAPGGPPRGPAPPIPGVGAVGGESPLIAPERRSNSLVVHARRQEMETIRRLIEKLDVDIYGGQRVFIYFAENTRARDLATTLDAIYGGGDRDLAIAGAQSLPGATSISGSYTGHALPSTAPPPPRTTPVGATPSRPGGPPGAFPGLVGEGAPPGTEIRFVADEVTNAVVVATYPRLWREMEETIRKLDKMPRQVLIEVLVAEVALNDDVRLGVEWAIRSGNFTLTSSPTGTLPGRPAQSLIPLGGGVPLGFNLFAFAADKFLAALNALAAENKVNVLSNPSIMTAENRKAVINVSTSVPIVTSQQVPVATGGITGNSITQTVEYKDAGVILTVTPRIGEQGTVTLDVKQEVNRVGENEPPPINSPRFDKREVEASVVLPNNQTLVLGGLIQNRRTKIRTGIPFLNRIPILGYLFGSVRETTERTELVLFITPHVVGTALDAARITDEMRRVSPEPQPSIPQAPRLLR